MNVVETANSQEKAFEILVRNFLTHTKATQLLTGINTYRIELLVIWWVNSVKYVQFLLFQYLSLGPLKLLRIVTTSIVELI